MRTCRKTTSGTPLPGWFNSRKNSISNPIKDIKTFRESHEDPLHQTRSHTSCTWSKTSSWADQHDTKVSSWYSCKGTGKDWGDRSERGSFNTTETDYPHSSSSWKGIKCSDLARFYQNWTFKPTKFFLILLLTFFGYVRAHGHRQVFRRFWLWTSDWFLTVGVVNHDNHRYSHK